jgi:hypothetical protein
LDSVYTYIEGMIGRAEPITCTLRMLALASLCGGGVPRKTLEALKRDFLQAYG